MYQQDKIQKSSLPVAQWATKKEVKGAVNAVQSRPENVASPAKENRCVMAKSRDGMLNNVLQTLMQGADSNSGASSLQATPVEEQKLTEPQGKGDWQQQADLSTIFGGSGSALPQGLMAKYQQLMPGVSLSHVRLHQGSQVDASLAKAGLQGLTDGTRVAVSGKAESGTLEHELGHVAQRQVQGFNLTEGNRQAYEQDADRISARLVNGQIVEGFQGSEVKTNGESAQAKCSECEKEDKRNLVGKLDTFNGNQTVQTAARAPRPLPIIIEDIKSLLAPVRSVASTLNPINIFRETPEEAMGRCFLRLGVFILGAIEGVSIDCLTHGLYSAECARSLTTLAGTLIAYGYCVRDRMKTLSYSDQKVIHKHLHKLDSLIKEIEYLKSLTT